jgi:glycosyltransferase involved in cell wall biosynthesis
MTHTVVHFVDSEIWGGCEEVALMLLAGLDRRRWRPVLFHRNAPGISRLLDGLCELGIPCRAVPRMTTWNLAKTLPLFIRELRAEQATILHVHLNWPLACRFGVMAAGLGRVPAVVGTSHLCSPISDVRFGWLKQRLQAATIDRYIAVSNGVRDCLCHEVGVPESKVRVVHNGIRLAPFDQPADSALRAELSRGIDRPIVFTPARLHGQKGQAYLLEAAALVPDALFVLAGDGPDRAALEERAAKLGVEARVRFLGHRHDIPQLLASCDLFVLPSLHEGLPLCVLEAMAAGKPVIATAISGTREAVLHGETGLLVAPGNPAELAAAIRTLLSDRKLANRLAQAGKARAKEGFSADAMVRGVTRIYDELISQQIR